jgi:Spy/CpxP family protein refolding chaperone
MNFEIRWGRVAGAAALLATVVAIPVALARGPGHGGPGGPMGHHPPPPRSADDIADHMSERADRMLDRVDATDAQRDQVDGIIDGLAPKLWELKDEREAVRDDAARALTAKTVDREGLEAARQRGLALADKASALLTDAVADTAEVLTVDQRTELMELWDEWHD